MLGKTAKKVGETPSSMPTFRFRQCVCVSFSLSLFLCRQSVMWQTKMSDKHPLLCDSTSFGDTNTLSLISILHFRTKILISSSKQVCAYEQHNLHWMSTHTGRYSKFGTTERTLKRPNFICYNLPFQYLNVPFLQINLIKTDF